MSLPALALSLHALLAQGDLAGTWRGSLELDGRRLELVGWLEPTPDGLRARLHVPALGATNLDFAEEPGEAELLVLACRVPDGVLRLTGDFDERGVLRGTWSRGELGGAFDLAAAEPERPYAELPVTFSAEGGPELAGTLLLPTGPGPFPALVWAHGSGALGRRSTDYVREPIVLALGGVATLVYDKRGVGESRGDWRTATFEELARDAAAGFRVLRERPEVDPGRIGVGGISQAASWIAPLARIEEPRFAFGVALSGTAVDAAEQHLWVVERRLANAGFDAEVVATALALHRRLDAWLRAVAGRPTLEPAPELAADLAAAATEPWFRTALLPAEPPAPYPEPVRAWMWLEPMPLWERFERPVFAAWGSRDDVTNPERGPRVYGEVLGASVRVHVYPGADHLLRLAGGAEPRPVAPGLHQDLLDWIRALRP